MTIAEARKELGVVSLLMIKINLKLQQKKER